MNKNSTARPNKHGYVQGGSNGCFPNDNTAFNNPGVGKQGPHLIPKRKEVRGTDASCTKRFANNSGKKHKLDEQNEAVLGKRQTMFLNLENANDAGTSRVSAPKRLIVPPRRIHTMKGNWINASAEKQEHNVVGQNGENTKDQNLVESSCMEDGNSVEPSDRRSESSGDTNAQVGDVARPKRIKTSSKDQNLVESSCMEDKISVELSDRISESSGDTKAKVGYVTRPKRINTATKDQNLVESYCMEDGNPVEPSDRRSESSGDTNSKVGDVTRPKRVKNLNNVSAEVNCDISRQCLRDQFSDIYQPKTLQRPAPALDRLADKKVETGKRILPKKQSVVVCQYQDTSVERPALALASHGLADKKVETGKIFFPKKQSLVVCQSQDSSVERLLREVTNEKLWRDQDDNELQCVPGKFESVEEYVSVFEPLLFEECRAQLQRTWQELLEVGSSDAHVMVRVKAVERREKGWFDAVVLPERRTKWMFKDGDVAVLSSARPGSDCEEPEVVRRAVGTVRRHIPVDTRDPYGATLHFYVGDSLASSSSNSDNILRKLKSSETWFFTGLGSIATTQREYVALHAFRRLNSQMQNAILQPSSKHFPKYKEQKPTIPECMTPKFVEHLHRIFNGPQLAAIQWAATHTAAGTSKGTTKKQDSWPFTLVQGPPGTGKTLTVWGLLNVIHLVQYQHYYTALLKKLAPESYKQANESSNDVASGSIDDFIQNMDQHLFSILPKLCPKPRMLVCAPSNAATDELLARVLNRGFIDGEDKVYRPDVVRVGADSQSGAVEAVSVERKTELYFLKSPEEISKELRQLKTDETNLSYQIGILQKQLNAAAFVTESQGSAGVPPSGLMARNQNRDTLLQNLAAFVESRDKVVAEMSRLLILKGKFRPGGGFNLEEARATLEASFANDAEIVFTTLSSSGRKLFSRLTHGFDMVVIDEAAQASEVGILPALSLGAKRCVLVGDPQQLPATVISKAAGTLLYSRSLFERFQQAGCPTMLLSVQYRMHPQIRDFPSRYFYEGRLTDSESVSTAPDEKYYQDPLLRPYIFFDIRYGRESHRGGSVSYQNVHEAHFCRILFERFQETARSLRLSQVTVGIITPYRLQLKCLQHEFREVLKSEVGRNLLINTIDAFQGQERDVIIMSCVRASIHGVGFVADIRRMNVALTRGKRALWVLGNANALSQSDDWAALIADAKSRNCFMEMDSLQKYFQIPQGSYYNHCPGKLTHRESRTRPVDMPLEYKPTTSAEQDNSYLRFSRWC